MTACVLGLLNLSAVAKTITVASDGSGEYKTLQEAIAAAPDHRAEDTNIHIKPGTYTGPFVIPKDKPKLRFVGDDAKTTVLTYDKNVFEPIPPGIDKFNPGLNVRADDFSAENITIQNTSGDHGQALAVRVDSDRATFKHCRLLGWQDTLMVNNGRQYFRECYIEGRVDFIYGSGTAVFDRCEIKSKNGGYVTASSSPEDHPYGLVFLDCKLTADPTPWNPASTNPATTEPAHKPGKMAYLGRPWKPFASVTFVRCEMGDHIQSEGWSNWGKPEREKTARYAEFGSTGPGGEMSKRVAWAKQLTKEQANEITIEKVLGGKDNWSPARE